MKIATFFLLALAALPGIGCSFAAQTETATTRASSENRETTNDRQTATDAALTAVEASVAPQQKTPDGFVKDLYAFHERNLGAIFQTKSRANLDKFFAKKLADLIYKDLTAHVGEIGVLDFDPFYNAQDADIKNLVVAPAKTENGKATVVASFNNYNRKESITFALTEEKGAWKIADIRYRDGGSLLKYFEEAAQNQTNSNSRSEAEESFFSGTYQVGTTTCTVKPIKMAFEVRWAKGSGTMIFNFDGETDGKFRYVSEDQGSGKRDAFVFDDDRFETGKFIRADGKEMPVKKIN